MNLAPISAALLKKGLRIARPPAADDRECVGTVECVTCGWRGGGMNLSKLSGDPDAGCCACAVRRME